MAGNEIWKIGSSAAQFVEWIFSTPVPQPPTQQEQENVHAHYNYGPRKYEHGESSNHIVERNPVEHLPGQHRYVYWGPGNHVEVRNSPIHYNPGQRSRYIYRGTTVDFGGRDPMEHYNPGRPVCEYGGSSNHTTERQYVEHHNSGRHGFEHGGSSNHIDERDYEEHYDDEALARALMDMDVDDHHSSTPSLLDNTISNHPQFYDVGQGNEGLSQKALSKLPSSKYKNKSKEKNQCVICYVEFTKGDKVITLPCKHFFHSECITKWLKIKKHCPLCQREVKR